MSQEATKFAWVKPMALGVVVGAIGLAIGGFSFLGWVTSDTLNKEITTAANEATTAALTPGCLGLAKADPTYTVKLEEIADAREYLRDDIVEDAGWANLPAGAIEPNPLVADACVLLLLADEG